MRCPSCGAENRLPSPPVAARGAHPYRTAEARVVESAPPVLTCPFCGGSCNVDARACPTCDVRLANVRCPTCFSLQATGERKCARCGHELELEPLPDPSDAPCPRCSRPLEALPGAGMHECAGCGGLFVDHAALARIVAERDQSGPLPSPHARPFERARQSLTELNVTYVKCPQCHQTMNRTNFGRRSGVVVDVCKMHGTWFDAGELTRVVEWVGSGGLEAAHAAAAKEKAKQPPRLTAEQAKAQAAMVKEALASRLVPGEASIGLTEELVDFAIQLLLW